FLKSLARGQLVMLYMAFNAVMSSTCLFQDVFALGLLYNSFTVYNAVFCVLLEVSSKKSSTLKLRTHHYVDQDQFVITGQSKVTTNWYHPTIGQQPQEPTSAVLQVSISLNKVELSVGESKFFTCTDSQTKPEGPPPPTPAPAPAPVVLHSLDLFSLDSHDPGPPPLRPPHFSNRRLIPRGIFFLYCPSPVIGDAVNMNWYSPQGERIISNQRLVIHTEGVRSRLTIYNAIIEDAGIYRCQVSDSKGQTQEATVVLEIYQKLTFREVKTPQEFRQGEDAEVVCDVISSPVPAVSWFYKNREITPERYNRLQVLSNNNLQILKVAKEDEGVYRCEARVEARGEIDFRDIVVVVNVPPLLFIPQETFNATADYQESVMFTCIASGSPDPELTWHRKGRQIETSEQYVLNTLEGGKSTLTVRNIRQGDGGPYTCRATNKAGSKESELLLKVFVQPHITHLRNVTAVEGSAAMISCTAEGEPLPEIFWRRATDGQTFSDGDKTAGSGLGLGSTAMASHAHAAVLFQSQDGRVEVRGRHGKSMLTITGVRLSDWGRFNCEALSRIGGHQKSMFLDIEYAPKFQINHTIFYSWEGNPVNLSCDVMSNPPATMLWRRDRFTISNDGNSNTRIHTAEGKSVLEVTPMSDRDFGRYNCTARNNIGARYQEFILAQAAVPSNPYSVRFASVSQRVVTVTFMKPDSHGGVPIGHYIVNYKDQSSQEWKTVKSLGVQTMVLLTNLEPNTTYEVRVAAVNGKGQGEYSHMEAFQTLPIREPSPPTVHGQRGMGKAYRLGLVKQDDGGMPIVEYIVKYKTDKEEQWMTKLVPGMNDFTILQPLQWNTRYNVEITARNVKGLSEPTFFQFLMPQKPDITVLQHLGGQSEVFQASEVVKTLTSLPGQGGGVAGPGQVLQDVNSKVPETVYSLHCGSINPNRFSISDDGVFVFMAADSLFSGLGLGAVVGLGLAGLLLLLAMVDVGCFFARQWGLLMCISRKLCGKKTATGGKGKEPEEGKAAYLGNGSKEPIVEMRTEEERLSNPEDGSPVHEPNETTPLTEPEKLPLKEENGKETLKPDLIEIKVHSDNSLHTKQDDSKA
ncbi:hypothetical protein P4O66_021328, partial [Electrophorus voltai]